MSTIEIPTIKIGSYLSLVDENVKSHLVQVVDASDVGVLVDDCSKDWSPDRKTQFIKMGELLNWNVVSHESRNDGASS